MKKTAETAAATESPPALLQSSYGQALLMLRDNAPDALKLFNAFAAEIVTAEYNRDDARDVTEEFTAYGEILFSRTAGFPKDVKNQIGLRLRELKMAAVQRQDHTTAIYMRKFEKMYAA